MGEISSHAFHENKKKRIAFFNSSEGGKKVRNRNKRLARLDEARNLTRRENLDSALSRLFASDAADTEVLEYIARNIGEFEQVKIVAGVEIGSITYKSKERG